MNGILAIQIIGGPVPPLLLALSTALVLYLLIGSPTRRRVLTMLVGIATGVAIALAASAYFDVNKTFEIVLPDLVPVWTAATLGAMGLAIVNLWRSRWWRKVIAAVGIVVFAITGAVQINAVFGLDPTVGTVLGITVKQPISLPVRTPTKRDPTTTPLYQSWVAPAGMPTAGKVGTVSIPATVSHFHARPAGLYLPPAALVKHPPALPLLIMMMGYPGTPDVSRLSGIMNQFASAHHGLAPIVVVADQIGTGGDPACADSVARGNARSYVMTDVVNWSRAHLNISQDPAQMVLAGYSNGAACAMKYAAEDPQEFRRVLAVSPEEFPGLHYSSSVIKVVYRGNRAAWEADKPINIFTAHSGSAAYADTDATVTTGALDTVFGPGTRALTRAAQNAGMHTTLLTIPGAGHVGNNLTLGLTAGFASLAPTLGLAPPRHH